MFNKFAVSNKFNIVLGLIAVFILILGTNRIDKRHFETAQEAVTSVYEDRVLAQDYIYKLNSLVYKKQLNYIYGSETVNISYNKEIETLINLFSKTKLILEESTTFKSLQNDFEHLKVQEKKYYNNLGYSKSFEIPIIETKIPMGDDIEAIKVDLNNLALIQVGESKSVLNIAQKSLDMSNLMSSMEVYFLLVIGIVVLVLTFYRVGQSTERNRIDN
ncbi:hypothetical protein VBZ51_11140 [Maribacter sp. HS]|uniref:hypothetical protein n=1 Tax=Maribacter sp. HS TaxID=3110480 RepID=UPI003A8857B3